MASSFMEQAAHITGLRILELGLAELRLRRPDVEFHLVQPEHAASPLSGPAMGFETSRAALRYGYESVRDYLARPDSAELRRRFAAPPARSEWAPRAEPAT